MIRKLAIVFAAAALLAGLCRIVSTPTLATLDTTLSVPSNLDVQGNLQVRGTMPTIARSNLAQESFAVYPLPFSACRVWDAFATALATTGSADDLGIYTGTWGTGTPYIATGDLKAAGATSRRCRFMFQLPAEYVAGESVRIRFSAGMITTIADTSATVDVEAYESARTTVITGSDLVTTSATTINSTTFADKNFDLTATSLSPGDWLDVRVTIAVNDAATVTAVIGAIGAIEVLLDIKG